ncbi:MAG: L,D-transpeptidase family protein [Bacteroidaceae bacterium]|nr:L,D-transpeptidase family protein [Bacteroidaceae bacterium]
MRNTFLLLICCLLASCFFDKGSESEEEMSAFGVFVDSLNAERQKSCLQTLLKSDTSKYKGDKVLWSHYNTEGSMDTMLLWSDRMGVSSDADSVLSYLRREVPRNGLDTTAFFITQIAEDLDVVHQLKFDSLHLDINEVLMHLDYLLTKAYVRYTVGMHHGFMRPEQTFNHLQRKKEGESYVRLFDFSTPEPCYPEALKKVGTNERLSYLKESVPKNPTYEILRKSFETSTDQDFRKKVAINMERCRWQIKQPEENERMVVVNIPAQQLWAVGKDSVLNMKICCGATKTKTPQLNSSLSYMQVNPEWVITTNIIKDDVSHHGGDSAYFARHRYFIVDKASGDTLNPAHVSGERMRSGTLKIAQRGGAGNSLGRIVFRFPNNFSVYLHDTNNRGAFNYERRTLSHGCVRVQKPFELACFLLPDADEWVLEKIRLSMDIPPKSSRGREYLKNHKDDPRPLRLISYHDISPRVPLYIVYYTAYPNPENGQIELWSDLYDYDKAIVRTIGEFLY